MSTCLVVVKEQLEVVLLVDLRVAVRVIMYHKPIANVLWTLSRLVKIIYTLQINWVSTTAGMSNSESREGYRNQFVLS